MNNIVKLQSTRVTTGIKLPVFFAAPKSKRFYKLVLTTFLEAVIPLYKLQHSSIKNLFNSTSKRFYKLVVTTFLEAVIPLYKLQHSSIKNLFNSTLGYHCPSESTCRKQVNDLASQESERIKKPLTRKPIFLIVDELLDVSGQKYVNVLAGLMEEPNKTYLIPAAHLSGNPNSSEICAIVDEMTARRKWGLHVKCFCCFSVMW